LEDEVILPFSSNGFTRYAFSRIWPLLADFALIFGHDARIAPSISD